MKCKLLRDCICSSLCVDCYAGLYHNGTCNALVWHVSVLMSFCQSCVCLSHWAFIQSNPPGGSTSMVSGPDGKGICLKHLNPLSPKTLLLIKWMMKTVGALLPIFTWKTVVKTKEERRCENFLYLFTVGSVLLVILWACIVN